MAKYEDLRKYLNYEFSTGCYTGKDYKTFETKYINYLKSIAKEYSWELVNVLRNHYQFSAFFKNKDKFVYVSISDVRYFKNEWFNHILYRTAEHEKDYHGGYNRYSDLYNLKYNIFGILGGVYA
ncbi:MAG: hypothetical protein LUI60_01450 [Clostridia bacterium]|nr:hypothetical protein [Clostridia bacterium]